MSASNNNGRNRPMLHDRALENMQNDEAETPYRMSSQRARQYEPTEGEELVSNAPLVPIQPAARAAAAADAASSTNSFNSGNSSNILRRLFEEPDMREQDEKDELVPPKDKKLPDEPDEDLAFWTVGMQHDMDQDDKLIGHVDCNKYSYVAGEPEDDGYKAEVCRSIEVVSGRCAWDQSSRTCNPKTHPSVEAIQSYDFNLGVPGQLKPPALLFKLQQWVERVAYSALPSDLADSGLSDLPLEIQDILQHRVQELLQRGFVDHTYYLHAIDAFRKDWRAERLRKLQEKVHEVHTESERQVIRKQLRQEESTPDLAVDFPVYEGPWQKFNLTQRQWELMVLLAAKQILAHAGSSDPTTRVLRAAETVRDPHKLRSEFAKYGLSMFLTKMEADDKRSGKGGFLQKGWAVLSSLKKHVLGTLSSSSGSSSSVGAKRRHGSNKNDEEAEERYRGDRRKRAHVDAQGRLVMNKEDRARVLETIKEEGGLNDEDAADVAQRIRLETQAEKALALSTLQANLAELRKSEANYKAANANAELLKNVQRQIVEMENQFAAAAAESAAGERAHSSASFATAHRQPKNRVEQDVLAYENFVALSIIDLNRYAKRMIEKIQSDLTLRLVKSAVIARSASIDDSIDTIRSQSTFIAESHMATFVALMAQLESAGNSLRVASNIELREKWDNYLSDKVNQIVFEATVDIKNVGTNISDYNTTFLQLHTRVKTVMKRVQSELSVVALQMQSRSAIQTFADEEFDDAHDLKLTYEALLFQAARFAVLHRKDENSYFAAVRELEEGVLQVYHENRPNLMHNMDVIAQTMEHCILFVRKACTEIQVGFNVCISQFQSKIHQLGGNIDEQVPVLVSTTDLDGEMVSIIEKETQQIQTSRHRFLLREATALRPVTKHLLTVLKSRDRTRKVSTELTNQVADQLSTACRQLSETINEHMEKHLTVNVLEMFRQAIGRKYMTSCTEYIGALQPELDLIRDAHALHDTIDELQQEIYTLTLHWTNYQEYFPEQVELYVQQRQREGQAVYSEDQEGEEQVPKGAASEEAPEADVKVEPSSNQNVSSPQGSSARAVEAAHRRANIERQRLSRESNMSF